MPVLQGTMSYQRFKVTTSDLTPQDVAQKIQLFKFRPLHPKGEDNESAGWVAFQSEYDHEKAIEVSDLYFDNKIILSFRVDTLSIPKQLLKSLVKRSLSAYFRDHQKMADKTVRKEIELAEIQGLRQRILPKTKLVEAVWNLEGELKIFCRSHTLLERFLSVFQDTFLLRPERMDCAAQAYDYWYKNEAITAMDSLAHAPIFMPPLRVDVQ
ncbi:MAG: hypothetical protein BWZ03_00745 [bacterium ADurb.BinA186]|nr:MAG: hypothetical protein BWZ03_00745 [bacterium ADurb.BinA186]